MLNIYLRDETDYHVVCPRQYQTKRVFSSDIINRYVQPSGYTEISDNAQIYCQPSSLLLIYADCANKVLVAKEFDDASSLTSYFTTIEESITTDGELNISPICIVEPGSIAFRLGHMITPSNIPYECKLSDNSSRVPNMLLVGDPYELYTQESLSTYLTSPEYYLCGVSDQSGIPMNELSNIDMKDFPVICGKSNLNRYNDVFNTLSAPAFYIDYLDGLNPRPPVVDLHGFELSSYDPDEYLGYVKPSRYSYSAKRISGCDITFKPVSSGSNEYSFGLYEQDVGCEFVGCTLIFDFSDVTENTAIYLDRYGYLERSKYEFTDCTFIIKYNPELPSSVTQKIFIASCNIRDCKFYSLTTVRYSSSTLTSYVTLELGPWSSISNCRMFNFEEINDTSVYPSGGEHIIVRIGEMSSVSGLFSYRSFYLTVSSYTQAACELNDCYLPGAIVSGFTNYNNCVIYAFELIPADQEASAIKYGREITDINMKNCIIVDHIKVSNQDRMRQVGWTFENCQLGSNKDSFDFIIDLTQWDTLWPISYGKGVSRLDIYVTNSTIVSSGERTLKAHNKKVLNYSVSDLYTVLNS